MLVGRPARRAAAGLVAASTVDCLAVESLLEAVDGVVVAVAGVMMLGLLPTCGDGLGSRLPVHARRSGPRGERDAPTDRRHRQLSVGLEVRLHLGTLEDLTLLRYDNSHEDTKGHELHTAAGDVDAEFPGMEAVLAEFWASADEYWDAVGGDPPRPY